MGGGKGLNTLLNQMDSLTELVEDRWRYKVLRWFGLVRGPVKNKPLVFVIGATNRPAVLDPALTRPGRLDRIIEVHRPDAEGRRDIIQHYLAKKAHDPDISMELLVNDSMGWTPIHDQDDHQRGADPRPPGRPRVPDLQGLADAADERALGLKQPIRAWNLTDRRETAYHEAGHAVAARYLRPEHRISKASIIRRGHALGFVQQRPREERTSLYARSIETEIMVLAGRARGRGPVPRQAARPVRRPTSQHATEAAEDYVGSLGHGPDQARPPADRAQPPAGPVLMARARAARPAVRGDRAAAPREGAGDPLPRQGAHRARRADRRGARGGLRRDRGALPVPAPSRSSGSSLTFRHVRRPDKRPTTRIGRRTSRPPRNRPPTSRPPTSPAGARSAGSAGAGVGAGCRGRQSGPGRSGRALASKVSVRVEGRLALDRGGPRGGSTAPIGSVQRMPVHVAVPLMPSASGPAGRSTCTVVGPRWSSAGRRRSRSNVTVAG